MMSRILDIQFISQVLDGFASGKNSIARGYITDATTEES